jgi:hypothetical protein
MKKLLMLVFGMVMAITIMSCTGEVNDTEIIESDEQVLAVEAISSAMLLSYNDSTVEQMANPMMQVGLGEDEVDEIDYYVEMIETFLGNDQLEVESQDSDDENYDYMIVYTTYNLNQEAITYTLYYNVLVLDEESTEEPTTEDATTEEATTEEATTEETTTEETTTEEATTEETTTEETTTEEPTTEEATTEEPATSGTEPLAFGDDEREHPFRFNDEDDEYVTQVIQGVLLFGDLSYEVEGKILVKDGKEITRLRSFIDEDNFVLVNYQKDDREVDKEKFFFQMVEAGQVVSRSRMMIFKNENMQHVQLEMIEGEEYARYQFHIRERDDVTYIHINYRIETSEETSEGHVRLIKTIDTETGEVIYEYNVQPNQGQESSHRKNHGRPDHAGQSQQDNRNPRTTM